MKHNFPITTHCSVGPVYYRGKAKHFKNTDGYIYKKRRLYHPKTKQQLPGRKAKHFTQHFSHPLNFECLFDTKFLSKYWNISLEEAKKYHELKINLGHYGSSDEWVSYLKNPWFSTKVDILNLDNWNHEFRQRGLLCKIGISIKNFISSPAFNNNQVSWFSIITDMLKKHPNLYADVAFDLHNKELLPLLKVILETNPSGIADRILFGTDFYMISTKAAERELTINLRGYLGEEQFEKIAHNNPKKFLKTKEL